GIRDKLVTGVQTCALPICQAEAAEQERGEQIPEVLTRGREARLEHETCSGEQQADGKYAADADPRHDRLRHRREDDDRERERQRSEERRVGKEWRSRWSRE